MSPSRIDLLDQWRAHERGQPSGWSFADLADVMVTEATPWDFAEICRTQIAGAQRVLDMGTGGGETLARLHDVVRAEGGRWPRTTATEGWAPNVPVARETLAPLGIDVVEFGQPDDQGEPEPMPFPDATFDLVINRHESYHPAEIARILRPDGVLLTQQVGGDELDELRALLNYPASAPHVQYEPFRQALDDAGLEVIDGASFVGAYTFAHVAALVAYLQRVPWDAPADFTVDRYANQLLALHERTGGAPFPLTMKRFWLAARRPGENG